MRAPQPSADLGHGHLRTPPTTPTWPRGGLLAQWASEGCAVHLVVICDGAKGSHALTAVSGSVRDVRGAELQLAADLLGATTLTSLDQPDGGVSNDEELRATLVGLIREHKPQVVLGPDPTATFFAGVYVNHRDHRETGWALLDAVAPRRRDAALLSRAGRTAPRPINCY